EIPAELPGLVAPCEIGVGLVEPELGQPVHDLRPCERFREEDDVRVAPTDLPDQPLPEGERLGVWVVYPKDSYALVDPELDYALELLPERAPLLSIEVEGVDVLVLLGWVLGVLDGAVGPGAEPLRVLAHVGVVGRDLEG